MGSRKQSCNTAKMLFLPIYMSLEKQGNSMFIAGLKMMRCCIKKHIPRRIRSLRKVRRRVHKHASGLHCHCNSCPRLNKQYVKVHSCLHRVVLFDRRVQIGYTYKGFRGIRTHLRVPGSIRTKAGEKNNEVSILWTGQHQSRGLQTG